MAFTHGRATGWNSRFAAALAACLIHAPLAAQERKPSDVAPIEQRVEAFASRLETKRLELGVLGGAFVIAEGDRIVKLEAFGLRQENPPLPTTVDTLFMMASATKQFTGMGVALAVSDGKMSLEDHPRRFIPGFKLKDAESDSKLAILDLLTHRTGLQRSDFTFLYYPFTGDEMFALAQRATPAAKLREKFIYQNTMFSLAGAAAGAAYGTTYERFMRERILQPLGMNATHFVHADFLASPLRAVGHSGLTAAERKPVEAADPSGIVPAGGMYSTARDVGAWLRFLNAGGQDAALRIAPAAYAQVFTGHQPTGGESAYGLGFEIRTRQGIVEAEHGGNLPGFTVQIVHVPARGPARGLSLALLTNQDSSGLAAAARALFWELVVKPELPPEAAPPPDASQPEKKPNDTPPNVPAGPAIAAEALIGTYFTAANTTFDVSRIDGALVIVIPNVPPLPLRALGVNHYELVGAGGYTLRFAESQTLAGRIEVSLHAPSGQKDPALPGLKKDREWLARARAQHAGAGAALIGFYSSADRKTMLEIISHRGALALNMPGEAPRALTETGADSFRIDGRPEADRIERKRTGDTIAGIVLVAPGGRTELFREDAAGDDSRRAGEILDAAVAAAGGAALDRIASLTAIGITRAEAHGLDGRGEEHVAPGRKAQLMELGAFGEMKTMRYVVTDGAGWSTWLDGTRAPMAGKALAAARLFAVPHPLYRWRERFASAALLREEAVNGEAAYVIQLTAANLQPAKIFVSKQTSLVVRVETPVYIGDEALSSVAVDYADHRAVGSVTLPFAFSFEAPLLYTVTVAYDRIVLDAPLDPKAFE